MAFTHTCLAWILFPPSAMLQYLFGTAVLSAVYSTRAQHDNISAIACTAILSETEACSS
jgi:hypothetical protein